ncbi:MAG TPA: hypothetical protein VM052_00965, partial [Candidatus Limnocylindrales bacterium]|nr:hypothetical protein [Candidatus Limnocylindrales bacterium]
MAGSDRDDLLIHPITKARRADFEALMKTNGITGSCWDIWPRRLNAEGEDRREYWKAKGVAVSEGNRRDMAALIRAGRPIGLLAYRGGTPVGFVSVG